MFCVPGREFSRNRIIDWGSINGSQGDLLTNGQIYNTENNAVALQRNDVEVEAVYVEFRSHMMIKPYNYTGSYSGYTTSNSVMASYTTLTS